MTALHVPAPRPAADTDPAPRALALRPYQHTIVDQVVTGLRGAGTAGQVHMACGSGKTIVALHAALDLLPGGGTVAVFAPSLALVAQTIGVWARHIGPGLDVLAACSDDTVADAAVRLDRIGAPVTTDAEQIAAWLHRPTDGLRLLASTYHTGPRVAEATVLSRPLDLAVFDESHHLAGVAAAESRRGLDRRRNTQRVKYGKGTLSAGQVRELESLGMEWSRADARWSLMFRAAQAFHAHNGHLNIPHAYTTPDGLKLGSRLLHQRQLRSGVKAKVGGISDEKIAALDALGVRW